MILPHAGAVGAKPVEDYVADYLVDLEHANRSLHTRRAYASDLAAFRAYYDGPLSGITAEILRGYFSTLAWFESRHACP
jgi:hypothetical protein